MALDRYSSQADIFAVPSRAQKMAGTLRTWGHRIASIPILSSIKILPFGAFLGGALTAIAGVLEASNSFAKGDIVQGTKDLISGAADTAATTALSMVDGIFWVNAASWLVSGDSLPEHARNATKWTLDVFDTGAKQPDPRTTYARNNQVLGYQPRTIGMATAGVGYAPGIQRELNPYQSTMPLGNSHMAPQNYFTNTIAQQRGQDPEQMRANWMRNDENRMSYQEMLAAREQQSIGQGNSRG